MTTPPITPDEDLHEWDVTYLTRIGCLCGTAEPDAAQRALAEQEADEHMRQLKALNE